MTTLVEQLLNTEAHKSIFESAVRQNLLPVCAAFGSSDQPQPVSFRSTDRVLSTKDSAGVRAQFPQSVAASGNVVLTSAGPSSAAVHGKRVAVLFSGGPAAGGHNVVCGLKRVPVSYTHLDVYKRQAEAAGIASVLLSLRDPLSRSTESGPAKK